MKSSVLYVLFILLSLTANTQALKPGDPITAITIAGLLNAPDKKMSLESLKGKVILLDFWATWCSPCIQSFDKLNELDKKLKDKLQIIAVSDESPERLKAFLTNRPLNFWVASDSSGWVQEKFPHASIPHAVLIDPNGVVRAVTRGTEINESVIMQAYRGETPQVSLAMLKETPKEVFDTPKPGADIFKMTGYQPQAKSGKSVNEYSMTYTNTHFSRLFLDVYNMNYARLRYKNIPVTEKQPNAENLYCLQISGTEKNPSRLRETLKEKLNKEFEYKTRLQKETDSVFVITRTGAHDTAFVKPANSTKPSRTNKGNYYARNQPIGKAIVNYLEGFGILDGVVLDESGDSVPYDVQFTWQPEKNGAVDDFLSKLGLKLEKKLREYDVLVIYKE